MDGREDAEPHSPRRVQRHGTPSILESLALLPQLYAFQPDQIHGSWIETRTRRDEVGPVPLTCLQQ